MKKHEKHCFLKHETHLPS